MTTEAERNEIMGITPEYEQRFYEQGTDDPGQITITRISNGKTVRVPRFATHIIRRLLIELEVDTGD